MKVKVKKSELKKGDILVDVWVAEECPICRQTLKLNSRKICQKCDKDLNSILGDEYDY